MFLDSIYNYISEEKYQEINEKYFGQETLSQTSGSTTEKQ